MKKDKRKIDFQEKRKSYLFPIMKIIFWKVLKQDTPFNIWKYCNVKKKL